MKIEDCRIEFITTPARLRQLDPARVDALAESMAEIGLQNPIGVYSPDGGMTIILVTGAHRLAAAKRLGWEFIPCTDLDQTDEITRQIIEIDENLIRAELSPTEQAEHMALRKTLWNQRETGGATCPPVSSLSDGRAAGPQHQRQFAAATAEAVGLSKSTINRSIARAEAIPEDVRHQITGTDLDTGKYLDGLKNLPEADQRAKVQADSAKSAPAAKAKPAASDDDMLAAFCKWWNKATEPQRRRAIAWASGTPEPGQMEIAEIVERLRAALRAHRIEARDRGFVLGVLKQSKGGGWWPSPAQEYAARRLVDEMMAEPVIDHGDGA